jgi:hypothetical protein
MSEDLFDGRDDNQTTNEENYVKLNAAGATVQLKVTDISDSFQAAHGEGYLVTGVVEVKRGDVEGPEVGEEGVYFVPLTTSQGKEHHVTQEVKKALKRVGKRALDIDDTIAVKFVEQLAPKKKGMSGFKKHAVVVKAGAADLITEDEAPF